MTGLKVLLVDDHLLFRKGLASLLSYRDDFQIVGEASDGLEAIQKAQETEPDIILMDVHMPNCDGLQAVRAIRPKLPRTSIIMLTADEQDETLFEAIKSGARGYLLKKLDPDNFYAMLSRVAAGDAALSMPMMSKILAEFQRPGAPAPEESHRDELTARELEVLVQVTTGASNKEIADTLGITENTVKKHLQSILDKLHMQNRIQAAVYAVQEGLLPESQTGQPPDG
jgi:DNA-binding NarL/FixJ family response regulator